MGSAMPSRWQPEVLPAPERWSITSSPAGAAVTIDGAAAGTTPTEHAFAYDRTYDVKLELDGYEPASRAVDLANMDEAAKADRSLDVSLSKVVPPGSLVIRASYPVTVTVDGRQHSGDRIPLPPGRYNVGLAAPGVFYFATQRVEIGSGRSTELALPATTDVSIAATPGNCRIRIDGRDAGIVPLNVKLAVGGHTIDFLWESIGKSMTVTESVDGSTKRIFRAAPRE
jgi:hypothetical protein